MPSQQEVSLLFFPFFLLGLKFCDMKTTKSFYINQPSAEVTDTLRTEFVFLALQPRQKEAFVNFRRGTSCKSLSASYTFFPRKINWGALCRLQVIPKPGQNHALLNPSQDCLFEYAAERIEHFLWHRGTAGGSSPGCGLRSGTCLHTGERKGKSG